MICPYCGVEYESKVTDSRMVAKFGSIRRRRECLVCGKRFTTYEIYSKDMKKLEQVIANDRRR